MSKVNIDELNIVLEAEDRASKPIGDLTKKLAALNKQIDKGFNVIGIKDLVDKLQGAAVNADKTAKATKDVEKAAKGIDGKETKNLADSLDGVAKDANRARKNIDEVAEAVKKADKGAKLSTAISEIEGYEKKLAGLKRKLAGLNFNDPKQDETIGNLAISIARTEKGLANLRKEAEETKPAFSKADALNFVNSLSQADLINEKMNQAVEKIQKFRAEGNKPGEIRAAAEYKKLQEALDKVIADEKRVKEEAEKAAEANKRIATTADAISYVKSQKELDITIKKYDDLIERIRQTLSADKPDQLRLSNLAAQAKKAQNDIISKGGTFEGMSKWQGFLSLINRIGERMSPIVEGVNNVRSAFTKVLAPVRAVKSVIGAIGTALATVKSFALGVVKTMTTLAKVSMSAAGAAVKIATIPFRPVINGLKNVHKRLGAVAGQLLKMVKMRFYRLTAKYIVSGLFEGVNNAYHWAAEVGNEFAASMDRISTAMQYLKNSLGAMAMPILNVLAPAVDYLVDKFVALLNVINQVVSLLTNAGSWTKAIKVPKAYANGLSDAGSAAQKLKKELITILGIDEINPMNGQDDTGRAGGSGGAAGTDYSSMFEEQEAFSDRAQGIAESIKKAWEDADFTSIGRTIGEKINSALENIPWESIKGTARKVGSSAATLLNGVFNTPELFANIGSSFAEIINTGFETAYSFVTNYDWQGFGIAITDGINGFMRKLDWNKIKGSAEGLGSGLANSLMSAVKNLKWTGENSVATTIAGGINSAIKGVSAFVKNISLTEVAGKITETLRQTINDIEWEEIGTTLNTLVKDGFDALYKLATSDFWAELGDNIFLAVSELDLVDIILSGLKLAAATITIPIRLLLGTEGTEETGKYGLGYDNTHQLVDEGWMTEDEWQARNNKNPKLYKRGAAGTGTGSSSSNDRTMHIPLAGEITTAYPSRDLKKNPPKVNSNGNITEITDNAPAKEKTIYDVLAEVSRGKQAYNYSAPTVAAVGAIGRAMASAGYNPATVEALGNIVEAYITSQTDSSWDEDLQAYLGLEDRQIKAWFESGFTDWPKWLKDLGIYDTPENRDAILEYYSRYENWKTWIERQNIFNGIKNRTVTLTMDAKATVQYNKAVANYNATKPNQRLVALQTKLAEGGAFFSGSWHKIPQYAGGTLNAGSMFIAGEAGPELVGHVGGRTEVLNQSQLAATMAASVESANSSQNALLREQNSLLRELIERQANARAVVYAGDIVDGLQQMNRRDGRTIVPIGV